MKKIYTAILFLSAAFALSSCVEQIETPVQAPAQESEFETMTIHVLETKSYLDDGIHKWSGSDKIHVFDQDGQRYTFKGESSAKESFVFTYDKWPAGKVPKCALFNPNNAEPEFKDGKFSAVHPLSQPIHNVGSFGKASNTSVAMIQPDGNGNYTAQFKNVCGYIKFNLATNYVKNIKIESVNGTPIAGDIEIDYNNGTPTYKVTGNPATSISLTPKSKSENDVVVSYYSGDYYACLLPCDLNGIKVTITNMNDRSMSISGSALMKITRNNVIDLGTLDKRVVDLQLGNEDNKYGLPTSSTKEERTFVQKDNFNIPQNFTVNFGQGYQFKKGEGYNCLTFLKDSQPSGGDQLKYGYVGIPAYEDMYMTRAEVNTLNAQSKNFQFFEDTSTDWATAPLKNISTKLTAVKGSGNTAEKVATWTFKEGTVGTSAQGYTLPNTVYYLTIHGVPTLVGLVHLEYTFTSLAPEAE